MWRRDPCFPDWLAGLERILTPGDESPFVSCTECGWDLREAGALLREEDVEAVDLQSSLGSLVQGTLRRAANGREYLNLLHRATELFAKDLGTVPFEYLKTPHRAAVLKRAYWLLAEDRWRFIQSVCLSARSSLNEAAKQ